MNLAAMLDRSAERQAVAALSRARHGQLLLRTPAAAHSFAGSEEGPSAELRVHDPRFFRRAVTGGEIALGDGYVSGEWSTPDLVGLIEWMLANRDALAVPAAWSMLARLHGLLAHRRRDNTRAGSRRNIHAHYDLGNQFFRLFLDDRLLYSSAFYETPADSLECAQVNKLRLICDKLALSPRDHVLEIGTGWGGFALFAASRYGCRVTTTTISEEQYRGAAELIAGAGDVRRRIDLRREDYRDLRGRFDKIVSIEMFEAVGLRHYDTFFDACDRLLAPDGTMLMQTITVDDWRFREYRREPNWIAARVFPGGELASLAEILASLARVSRMSLFHAQQIGIHYARTLAQWRERFHRRLGEVRAQGFDDRFVRTWDLYLAFSEAAFRHRHIGNVQLLLTKAANPRRLYGEPCASATPGERWTACR
jgi:cyclopropane-fatty-acyl-phospholipid synthase